MGRLEVRSFLSHTTWYVLAAFTFAAGATSAVGQIATTTTVTLSPTPVYPGEIPVATVTVTASDGSTPPDSATYLPVSCVIQARGHNAAYAANLQNGVASIPLTSLEFDPVDNEFKLACTYDGVANYAASSAALLPFSIINCTVWIVNSDGTVSLLN
jgi:hypothetical protein